MKTQTWTRPRTNSLMPFCAISPPQRYTIQLCGFLFRLLAVYISLFYLRSILLEAVSIDIVPMNNDTYELKPTETVQFTTTHCLSMKLFRFHPPS